MFDTSAPECSMAPQLAPQIALEGSAKPYKALCPLNAPKPCKYLQNRHARLL